MRESKFRGQNRNKTWFRGDVFHKTDDGVKIVEIYDDATGFGGPVLPETVGQYTERKDAREAEIYDGDILQEDYPDWKYIVYWDETMLQWSYRKIGQEQSYAFAMSPTALRHFTVVGNKWDNPELMQEGGAE